MKKFPPGAGGKLQRLALHPHHLPKGASLKQPHPRLSALVPQGPSSRVAKWLNEDHAGLSPMENFATPALQLIQVPAKEWGRKAI